MAESVNPVRFLLGVGAQKTGTSWLHDYLSTHSQVAMTSTKELHIFDSFFNTNGAERLARRSTGTSVRLARKVETVPLDSPRHAELLQRLIEAQALQNVAEDLGIYPRYFAQLAQRAEGIRVVGEITPSYSMLNSADLTTIRILLESAGFAVRPVFLMRDPVERVFSAYRFRSTSSTPLSAAETPEEHQEILQRLTEVAPQMFTKSRYDLTLDALETAFGRDGFFAGFYEELFSEPEIRRLSDFLEIDYVKPNFERRVLETKTTYTLAPETRQSLRTELDVVYREVGLRYGAERINRLWKNAGLEADLSV